MRRRLRALLGATFAIAHCCASAQPTDTAFGFSSAPMLVDGRLPAPNLVLAIDGGPHSPGFPLALPQAFGAAHAADHSLRLAWQVAGRCESLPDAGLLCLGQNGLGPLDDVRRSELAALAQRLALLAEAGQDTGSSAPSLVAKASAFLQGSAGSDSSGLQCRKNHVLLATPHRESATLPDFGQEGTASDDGNTPASLHRAGTGTEDVARQLAAAVDAVVASSQGLPTRTIASLAADTAAPATTPTLLFASRFDADRWSGEVAAQRIAGSAAADSSPWGRQGATALPQTSASLLDERPPGTRIILTSHGAGAGLAGTAFRWADLAPWQQEALDADDAQGAQRLDYLRGERALEQANGGGFRNRTSRQGDSVHSRLWHLPGTVDTSAPPREPLLFVGSNAGMLHAFSASTGAEAFAYVPQGAYAGLAALSRPGYRHRYLVDGSPWTAEMADPAGRSRTLLAGFMGAGAPGYFVLDVTEPVASRDEAAAAARMVLLDTTASQDPDIGHITGAPVRERSDSRQFARLNNGRWALVIGNGYGSKREQAVLLIQFLDGPRELLKIPAGEAGGNGLSAARLVDIDGDQTPDAAYAGDLRGNLWKFDLASGETGQWQVAPGGKPLLLARDATGKAQPVTTAPLVMPHPAGGRMVVLATGRLLADADRAGSDTQSIYGILDPDEGHDGPARRSMLVQQTIAPDPVGTSAGRRAWTSSANPVPTQGASAGRGWYVDLPAAGERVIEHPLPFEGKLVDVISMAPSAAFRRSPLPESCEPPATQHFRTTLNALDGARPRSQLYGEPGAAWHASRIELGSEPTLQIRQAGRQRSIAFGGKEQEAPRHRLELIGRRAGWRQLQ